MRVSTLCKNFLRWFYMINLINSIIVLPCCTAQVKQSGSNLSSHSPIYFGAKIGTAIADGDIQNTWKTVFGGSALAGYQLSLKLAFEGEFNIYPLLPKSDNNKIIDPGSGAEIELYEFGSYFGLLMSLKYSLYPVAVHDISPFISGGAGFEFIRWDLTDEVRGMTDMASSDGIYATAFTASIGADIQVQENLFTFVNFRYVYHLWSDELIESKHKINFNGNVFILTFGGAFYL